MLADKDKYFKIWTSMLLVKGYKLWNVAWKYLFAVFKPQKTNSNNISREIYVFAYELSDIAFENVRKKETPESYHYY